MREEPGPELRLGPPAHAPRSPGTPPPHPAPPHEGRSRVFTVSPGLRRGGRGLPPRREPPQGELTRARERAARPLTLRYCRRPPRLHEQRIRSSGRPTAVTRPSDRTPPERALPSAAPACRPLTNRKSRRAAVPPPSASLRPIETRAALLSRPLHGARGGGRVDPCVGGAGPVDRSAHDPAAT